MSEQIVTPVGRLLWTQFAEPDENGKYSAKVAFEEEDIDQLRDLVKKVSFDKFGQEVSNLPFKDGNEQTNDDGEVWPWTKDKTIVVFRTKHKPGLIGPGGGADRIDPDQFYNGCYVRLVADFYGWTYKNKKGVSGSMHAVQFYRHGDKIGGGAKVDVNAAFDPAPDSGTVSPLAE